MIKTYYELQHVSDLGNVFTHLSTNKHVLELMQTYSDLKHLSQLDNVFMN